jgi:4,5-DOPA dioxygenase extradiol
MTTIVSAGKRLPALFISHGTPMLGLQDDDYTHALRAYAEKLPSKPKAIVVVSAHGLSKDRTVEINAAERPRLVYDFRGFPEALYQLEYPCPGSPQLAVRMASLLTEAGFQPVLNKSSGLDHGVWIPLKIAFPEADIPVVQVSMPYPSQPELVLKMGKALSGLRDEGVLLVGSGGIVHNLGELVWHEKNGTPAPWAREFDAWVRNRLERKDVASLCDFEEGAPSSRMAHPSPEHFYPLFFTVGASAYGDSFRSIYEGIQYSSLSMSCFALEAPASGAAPAGTDAATLQ